MKTTCSQRKTLGHTYIGCNMFGRLVIVCIITTLWEVNYNALSESVSWSDEKSMQLKVIQKEPYFIEEIITFCNESYLTKSAINVYVNRVMLNICDISHLNDSEFTQLFDMIIGICNVMKLNETVRETHLSTMHDLCFYASESYVTNIYYFISSQNCKTKYFNY